MMYPYKINALYEKLMVPKKMVVQKKSKPIKKSSYWKIFKWASQQKKQPDLVIPADFGSSEIRM